MLYIQVLRHGNVGNNKHDGDQIAVTDNGNYIVDLHFSSPLGADNETVLSVAQSIKSLVGVVDHGLFESSMVSAIIVATSTGVRVVGESGETVWW